MTDIDVDANVIDAIQEGFTTAALWADCIPAESNENGELGGFEHLTPTRELIERDRAWCAAFYANNREDCDAFMDAFPDPDGGDPGEYLGHTFYLSTAGHGVSFTDRAWRDDDPMTSVCERLDAAARGREFREIEFSHPWDNGDGTAGIL